MIIDVFVCKPDGTQTMEKLEVPDDWNSVAEPPEPHDESQQPEYATYAELAQAIKEGVNLA